MFKRLINPLKSNSFFLFGARGTGKTTFLKSYIPEKEALWFNLLDAELEDRLSKNPQEFKQRILEEKGKHNWIVVDEVQKVPKLLNIVHDLIETTSLKFALTGSSARKLKKGGVNLLAGRAFVYNMFPLSFLEMEDSFLLDEALNWGLLPKIYHFNNDNEKEAYLKSYALTYLKEEVWSEHLIRNLDPFRKFIEVAAQSNGELINFSNIADDVNSDIKTVQSYFSILEDTLLGFFLEPYSKSIRKRQSKASKFFLFDIGIKRALDHSLSQKNIPNTYAYGRAFEHFIILEIIKLNSYFQKDFSLSYLRTKDNAEIDLIIERPGMPTALIEIKSSEKTDDRDIRTLEHFLPDFENVEAFCLSQDKIARKIGKIRMLHWRDGLRDIGLLP